MMSSRSASRPTPVPPGAPPGLDDVRRAVTASQDYLLSQQHPDGYWCGELEADSMLEADYIYLHVLLGSGDPGRLRRALTEVLRCRNKDGSWSLYPGGPGNISLAVKCYFACKLMGMGADDPLLVQSRQWILDHGGVVECNTFTKIYLCSLGQYDYDAVPAIPPEIVLFPNWFYFNIYEISSWSRSILVPLAIIYAKKPFKQLPPGHGIDELFVGGRANSNLHLRPDRRIVSWRNFFLGLDRLLHWAEACRLHPLRRLALRRAEQWMLERLELSDGLGAIYPAMLNAIIALRCLGYGEDHPQVIRARLEFEKLGIEIPATADVPEPTFRMQPTVSPVWDTAQAVYALGESGLAPADPRLVKAARWLLGKEVRQPGDWAVKVGKVEPGGWYFEFANEFYPDTDDTAQVLLALSKVDASDERQPAAAQRALRWEFAMQCGNGGWGSFDRDCTKTIFESIPFADHNAMLDPPTADITGRILETLAVYGHTRADPRGGKGDRLRPVPAGARWKLVWALGGELCLWHLPGPAGSRRGRIRSPGAPGPAGGGMHSPVAERRWRLGRDLRHLRRSGDARDRPEHPVADGLGGAGTRGGRGRPLGGAGRRRPLAGSPDSSPTAAGTNPPGPARPARRFIRRLAFPRFFI